MKVIVNRPPKQQVPLSKLVYIFCPNLMVLAWICGELWRGQAQNGVNLAFQVKFDLEGQGQSPPKTIGTLTKFFCTFCPNLMVLAWTRDDLWQGQAQGWRTHTQTDTHTDRQTQATTIPEGQNWPRVKTGKTQLLIISAINWTNGDLLSKVFCGINSIRKVHELKAADVDAGKLQSVVF